MRVRYTFQKTPPLRDISLEVENRGDKIIFDISATGAAYAELLKMYFDWFNARGPIATHNGSNVYSLYLPPIPSEAHSRMVEGFFNTFFFRKPTPQAVTIGVTDKCQCGCQHCSAAAYVGSRSLLSLQDIESIVSQSIELGVNNITFTGGDPLLRDELEECVRFVPEGKAVVQVFTNAVALDSERAASLKAAGVYGVQISLDSPEPEEHDRFRRRPGTFNAVAEGVKNALEAGLLVALSTYATNDSVRERKLGRLTALGAKWGVHEISVFDVIPTGRLLHSEEALLSKESREALLDEARSLNKRYKERLRIITQSWTNSGTGFARAFGCLAGNYQFHVTAYGDFTPCDFTPISFGNVGFEPIAELWKKVTEHPAYCRHSDQCRMQSAGFREKYIHTIPEGASLPFPIQELTKDLEMVPKPGAAKPECE